MNPRERVLAALNRQPVDRIPYCEHLVDMNVAQQTLGPEKTAEIMAEVGKRLGIPDLPTVLAASRKAGSLSGDPEQMALMFRMMAAAEPLISKELHRDNITYWGAAGCFAGGQVYLLNPEQAHLGSSADGILKSFDDLDRMVFRTDIDRIVSGAEEFLRNKGDLAACALIFMGLDPTWHSMGFETFCIACLQEPELVKEILGRVTDWYANITVEMCKLDFDFIWAADDIAYNTAPFFSPKVYREILLPHTRKVAAKITKPWIYHSDGNLLPIWDDLTSQGMNAIHPLEAGSMDLERLKADYGDRITFVGGLDLRILEAGTPEETRRFGAYLIETLGPTGYIYCSSNSITPNVKPENYRAMIETLLEKG
jgi:Uroporphyrinogen decarboxylase (URO-D)